MTAKNYSPEYKWWYVCGKNGLIEEFGSPLITITMILSMLQGIFLIVFMIMWTTGEIESQVTLNVCKIITGVIFFMPMVIYAILGITGGLDKIIEQNVTYILIKNRYEKCFNFQGKIKLRLKILAIYCITWPIVLFLPVIIIIAFVPYILLVYVKKQMIGRYIDEAL